MKYVIIGSGASGVTCASEIRKRDKKSSITIISRSKIYPYCPCSLPYTISGEANINEITTFDKHFFEINNIKLHLSSEVEAINKDKREVFFRDLEKEYKVKYDYLIIASGSKPYIPDIKGLNEVKYFKLYNVDDAKEIIESLKNSKKYVIIGGGLVGIELADALRKREKTVTVIETYKSILSSSLDSDICKIIKSEMNNVEIFENTKIKEITPKYVLTDKKIKYDSLIIVTGARKDKYIAEISGLANNNGILVNEKLQTADRYIYACGDCVEIQSKKVAMLATNALRQAKIVVSNIFNENKKIEKEINASCSKIGSISVASCGKTSSALEKGTYIEGKYSGNLNLLDNRKTTIKIISDLEGHILGAQIVGDIEIVGRINWLALAINQNLTVSDVINSENAYNPALSTIYDPVQIACEVVSLKLKRLKK